MMSFAIEECLRLKEKNGGEVTAISLGGDAHKETLRKALAMGVDKAVPVEGRQAAGFNCCRAWIVGLPEGNLS